MRQFNYHLQLIMHLFEEIHSMLEVEEEKIQNDEWIDMTVERSKSLTSKEGSTFS